jgi:hypothetical protein
VPRRSRTDDYLDESELVRAESRVPNIRLWSAFLCSLRRRRWWLRTLLGTGALSRMKQGLRRLRESAGLKVGGTEWNCAEARESWRLIQYPDTGALALPTYPRFSARTVERMRRCEEAEPLARRR